MSEKQPFVTLNAFKGAEFNINGETKTYSIMELFKMKDFLKGHLKTCAHLYRDLKFYEDYDEAKIDKYLKEQEDGQSQAQEYLKQDEDFQYSIGDNFANYFNTSNRKILGNHQAEVIIKKEYSDKFGQNTLDFDSEMSHCYVYTKDKEEAKQFLLFVYEKYIKSYLEPWYDGFDDFVIEFNNSSTNEKQMFDHLNW